MIKEKLERGFPTLIVDTGDFCRGKSGTSNLMAQYLAKAMSLMGYDAVNVAGGEIILGSRQILELRDRNHLPLVSSNLYRQESGRHLVRPYLIKRVGASRFLDFQYGGVKVAMVGLASGALQDRMGQTIPSELLVAPPEEALSATLEKLRKHCDVLIVLSNLDLEEATQLAQEVGGIDLFFIGQRAKTKYAEESDETIFLRPALRGDELGDIELVLDEHNRVTSHQVEWTLLDKSVADEEEMSQLVAEYKAAYLEQRPPKRGPRRD